MPPPARDKGVLSGMPNAATGNVIVKAFQEKLQALERWLPSLAGALLVMLAAILIARLARRAIRRGLANTTTAPHVELLLARLASFGILGFGVLVALTVLGVKLAVLVGSLGIATLAIGIGVQDLLGNVAAGLVLLLEHPFTVGDHIATKDVEGTVEDIQVRATRLRTADGQRVIMPNKLLTANPLTNASATAKRRVEVVLTIPTEEQLDATRKVLLDVVTSTEDVLEEPAPQVLTEEVLPDGIRLGLRFWVNPHIVPDINQVRSDVLARAGRALREASIFPVASPA